MVMNCVDSLGINGRTVRRVGCAFVNPTAPMLTVVQRYVSKLERDQRRFASVLSKGNQQDYYLLSHIICLYHDCAILYQNLDKEG